MTKKILTISWRHFYLRTETLVNKNGRIVKRHIDQLYRFPPGEEETTVKKALGEWSTNTKKEDNKMERSAESNTTAHDLETTDAAPGSHGRYQDVKEDRRVAYNATIN
ncbi:hypothetical protein LAZ67_13000812 [Cordylochernes scorpioides]|uniref:Uncharacterized protein n=1 Tax=Cordylochernes scorpioides TaxID=51811 RepID=A0ABY6L577_9ARAC|nr:hypothetical protein LAZ67_13000812 [Cordylochernes scorpioides]